MLGPPAVPVAEAAGPRGSGEGQLGMETLGKVTIIANPAAGRRSAVRVSSLAADALASHARQVEVSHTEGPRHATELAQEHGPDSELVVAVGGDGTVSEVLAGLVALPAPPPLAIVPTGSGNDFAAALGVALRAEQAVRQVLQGSPCRLDYGVLIPGNIPFTSVVGCGFDARVAGRLVGRRRRLAGRAVYVHWVLQELLVLRSMPARVRVDDQALEGDFLLIAIANGPAYGAGMRIAPQASLTDGLLDVIAIERVSRLRFARHFPRVFSGQHLDLPEVRVLRGSRVRIDTAEPGPVLVDGDIRADTPIEARVEPRGGLFWIPRDSPLAEGLGQVRRSVQSPFRLNGGEEGPVSVPWPEGAQGPSGTTRMLTS